MIKNIKIQGDGVHSNSECLAMNFFDKIDYIFGLRLFYLYFGNTLDILIPVCGFFIFIIFSPKINTNIPLVNFFIVLATFVLIIALILLNNKIIQFIRDLLSLPLALYPIYRYANIRMTFQKASLFFIFIGIIVFFCYYIFFRSDLNDSQLTVLVVLVAFIYITIVSLSIKPFSLLLKGISIKPFNFSDLHYKFENLNKSILTFLDVYGSIADCEIVYHLSYLNLAKRFIILKNENSKILSNLRDVDSCLNDILAQNNKLRKSDLNILNDMKMYLNVFVALIEENQLPGFKFCNHYERRYFFNMCKRNYFMLNSLSLKCPSKIENADPSFYYSLHWIDQNCFI